MTGSSPLWDEPTRTWREGKVRPLPGNSPHDRLGKAGGTLNRQGEFATIPSRHFDPCSIERTILSAQYAFLRQWRNLSVRCWSKQHQSQNQILGGTNRLPLVGPGPQARERVGRTTPFSSSAMSSAPAIPRPGCSPALPVSASPALSE